MRQEANIWANVDSDLCPYMVSISHNELTNENTDQEINSFVLANKTTRAWRY